MCIQLQHIVTSVGYSIEYYDARNNKYKLPLDIKNVAGNQKKI